MFKIFPYIAIAFTCLLTMSCSLIKTGVPKESHLLDKHDGTFIDINTLVQWTKIDTTPGPVYCDGGTEKSSWYVGFYLKCLNKRKYLGYDDWRLPSDEELESLQNTPEIRNTAHFTPAVWKRLEDHRYWVTTDEYVIFRTPPENVPHQYERYYVWPVRSDFDEDIVPTSGDIRYNSAATTRKAR